MEIVEENMTTYQLGSTSNSFSSHSNTLASALMATAILGGAIPDASAHVRRLPWSFEQAPANSYSGTVVFQASSGLALTNALQDAYEQIASVQQELDPETMEILHSNLWSLYR